MYSFLKANTHSVWFQFFLGHGFRYRFSFEFRGRFLHWLLDQFDVQERDQIRGRSLQHQHRWIQYWSKKWYPSCFSRSHRSFICIDMQPCYLFVIIFSSLEEIDLDLLLLWIFCWYLKWVWLFLSWSCVWICNIDEWYLLT